MKHKLLKTAAMLGLLLALAAVSVSAQSSGIKASIPFDFAAGEARLKAGDYTIKRISKNALLMRSSGSKTGTIVFAPIAVQQTRSDSPERLVFNRYGEEYFLTQVWTDRNADGNQLYSSKAETRLAKQMNKTRRKPQPVEIVARRD